MYVISLKDEKIQSENVNQSKNRLDKNQRKCKHTVELGKIRLWMIFFYPDLTTEITIVSFKFVPI